MEIVSNFDKETYRAVYTFKIENCIFVLHCFHKKSKKDKKIPKNESEIIEKRYKDLTKPKKSLGKKMFEDIIINSAKKTATAYVSKQMSDIVGVNKSKKSS